MDVLDRLTYNSALGSAAVEAPSRLRTEPGSSGPAADVSSATAADSSSLSRTAQSIAQTMSLPEVRQERVSQLQQQISSGTYQVDPQAVADAMLRSLRG